jgi:hypothetical protein
MPTTRRLLPAALFLAALLLSACTRGQTAGPTATPAPATAPTATAQTSGRPETPPSTTGPPVDRPVIRRCAASALRGSPQGSDGAAGTIYFTIQLRNVSARTCTVKGSPGVRLLEAQGQPLFAAAPARPDGALMTLRPGRAARLVVVSPHVCDSFVVTGSRIRVTLPQGQGSLVVPLGENLDTCRGLSAQPLEPATG